MRSLNAHVRAAVNLCIITAELRSHSQRFPAEPSCQRRANALFIFIRCHFTFDWRGDRSSKQCCGLQGVNVQEADPLCQMTSRLLSEMNRSRAHLMPQAVPHTPRCQARTCYCVVTATCLMAHDHHSHANASVLIGVTCVLSIMNPYLYLSCQLLIAFSHHTSLLIWHAVSNSLLIIFKQIWGDRNQFSIILVGNFLYPSGTAERTWEIGYARLSRSRVNNRLICVWYDSCKKMEVLDDLLDSIANIASVSISVTCSINNYIYF